MGQGLRLLREEDLLELGVLRGHARRIMARRPSLRDSEAARGREMARSPAGPA